jgi:hypothetical protein
MLSGEMSGDVLEMPKLGPQDSHEEKAGGKADSEGCHTFDHNTGIDNARRLHCAQTDERIHAQQGCSSKFKMKM